MDEILKYRRTEEEDYYKILECDETSNTEQILAGYKALSLLYHPDKNPDNEDAVKKFQQIVKAKDILTNPEKRALYDKWYRSGFSVPFEQFSNLSKAAHTSVHWVSKKKDLMLDDGSCNPSSQCQVKECSSETFSQKVAWDRDPACDLLKKFRNYEI